MDKKLLAIGFIILGVILFVFGSTSSLLAPLNLYSRKSEVLGSAIVPIAAEASNEFIFSKSISYEKQVEVVIENGPWSYNSTWGNCYWIQQSFQVTLLNGSQQHALNTTTNHSPRVELFFNIPISWNDLEGIRISNPESYPVSVLVTVVFHHQILNETWLGLLYLGITSILVGILVTGVILVYYTKKERLIGIGDRKSKQKELEDKGVEQCEYTEKDKIIFLLVLGFICLAVSFGFFSPSIGWFISRYGAQFVHVLAVLIAYITGGYAYIHGKNLRWTRSLGLTIIIVETLWLIFLLFIMILFLTSIAPV